MRHLHILAAAAILTVVWSVVALIAADPYESYRPGLESPGVHAYAITPSDTTDLSTTCRAIYVGSAGDIVVDMAGGETSVTFSNVTDGGMLPIRVRRVYSTGTTATNLVCVY